MIGFAPVSSDYTCVGDCSSNTNTDDIIVFLFGMVFISIVTSLIGAMMGLKCKSTSCCISRHFLKRWCNIRSAYRHSRYRQRRNRCRCMQKRYCLRDQFKSEAVNSSGCELPPPLPENRCRPCCPSSCTSRSSLSETPSTNSVQHHIRDSGSSSTSKVYDRNSANNRDSKNDIGGKFSNSKIKTHQSLSQSGVKILQSSLNVSQTVVEDEIQMVSSSNRSRGNVMLRLARMQDWDNLVRRCATHPDEARKIDSDGLIPLHWACSSGPPIHAVEALLKAYPDSAKEIDFEGSTALHFLVFYGVPSLSILHLLWTHNPKAVTTRDVHGRTPLYHACDKGVSSDVLKLLLLYEPQALTIPRSGGSRTPLSMTWRTALKKNVGGLAGRRKGTKFGKEWEKAMLMLEVAYTGTLPTNEIENCPPMKMKVEPPRGRRVWKIDRGRARSAFRMVHASIEVSDCPSEVFDVAIEMNPHQANERDEDGRLPLHVAAAATAERRYGGRASGLSLPLLTRSPLASSATVDERQRYRNVIKTLTRLHPEAARSVDNQGRLPIFLALESGKFLDDGIRDILHCYMDVLFVKDSKTRLYPFMLAACANDSAASHNKKAPLRKSRSFAAGPVFSISNNFESVSTFSTQGAFDCVAGVSRKQEIRCDKEEERLKVVGRTTQASRLFEKTKPVEVDQEVRQIETIYELLRSCPASVQMG